jgi:hypothetical protein
MLKLRQLNWINTIVKYSVLAKCIDHIRVILVAARPLAEARPPTGTARTQWEAAVSQTLSERFHPTPIRVSPNHRGTPCRLGLANLKGLASVSFQAAGAVPVSHSAPRWFGLTRMGWVEHFAMGSTDSFRLRDSLSLSLSLSHQLTASARAIRITRM